MYIIREGSFWSIKTSSSLDFWMWKKLLKYRDLAKSFTKTEVNTGTNTSFWFDEWTQIGRLIALTGNRRCIDMGIQIHSSVASVLATHRRRRHRVELLNTIDVEIETLRGKADTQSADRVLWKQGDKYKPKFSSKETWLLIREVQPICMWSKGIWFQHCTPKYSFITWLATRNRLATGDRMQAWNIGANTSCIFCQEPYETREHLFFSCSYSAEIWGRLTQRMLDAAYTKAWDEIMELLLDESRGSIQQFLLRYVFQAAVHFIWRERNSRRHGDPPIAPSSMAHGIDKQVRNRLTTIRRQGIKDMKRGWSCGSHSGDFFIRIVK